MQGGRRIKFEDNLAILHMFRMRVMKERTESLQESRSKNFDLVVIGGGITGAGVAQNAAARGLSVLVIEKTDFGAGTSSKTTKLIHGGLRYLEQFHINLCRQLCEERERLKRLAPHLVKDFSFVLPFARHNTFFNFKATVGLTLYDVLTMSAGRGQSHAFLNAKKLATMAPALSTKYVGSGIKFHDAITDDTRMVLTVIKSACKKGAVAINYVEVTGFQKENGRITAVKCHDRYSGEEFVVPCKMCVNATGVWSDEVCNKLETTPKKRISPSKGTHIIVPASVFETNTALFLPTKDNRFVFVVPWQHALMIGTTDQLYKGDIDRPHASNDEINYLLSVVNSYTESHKLQASDVRGTFAGLRPLVNLAGENSDNTSSMSREHEIFQSPGGLINIAGGKLTSYRLMAEELMEKLVAKFGLQTKPANTDIEMLGGWTSKDDFLARSVAIETKAKRLSIDPATIEHLIANYGAEAQDVIDLVEQQPNLNERICANYPPIYAEVAYAVVSEMAVSLQDVLLRRTRLGLLNRRDSIAAATKVTELMAKLLNWDDARKRAEISAFEEEVTTIEGAELQPAPN
jgi:glycerol-3-phosphate dehydrogenase